MPTVVSSITYPNARNLGQLRSDLAAALGFSAAGASVGVLANIIDLKLRDANKLLYEAHDWVKLKFYTDVALGTNQYLIDYPTHANPERIKAISVLRGSVWSAPLPKGITPEMYTTQDNTSWPQRWEPYQQIELWPKADQIYTLRIFYIRALARFTQDADYPTVDEDLVYLVALARLKAHYRQPDAKVYADDANALLASLKAKSWGKDTFSPYDYCSEEALVKPEVV